MCTDASSSPFFALNIDLINTHHSAKRNHAKKKKLDSLGVYVMQKKVDIIWERWLQDQKIPYVVLRSSSFYDVTWLPESEALDLIPRLLHESIPPAESVAKAVVLAVLIRWASRHRQFVPCILGSYTKDGTLMALYMQQFASTIPDGLVLECTELETEVKKVVREHLQTFAGKDLLTIVTALRDLVI